MESNLYNGGWSSTTSSLRPRRPEPTKNPLNQISKIKVEDKTDEEKLADLHDDIKDDEIHHISDMPIHDDAPEEEVAESEHADMADMANEAVVPPGQPIVPPNDPRLPKFLVIGVMKCGTGATQHFLSNHPNLRPAKQEAYFFNNDHKYLGLGYEYYMNLFPEIKDANQVNYEKTPTYYKSVRAQARVKAMNSTIQLVNIGKHLFPSIQTIFGYRM